MSLVLGQSQEVATDFEYITLEGKKQTFAELKGEVIYISFWASWCGPCMSNFKKYEEVRDELENLGVLLLNVNIDKHEAKWRSALVKNEINGMHVRGTDLDQLQKDYNLYSIPVYEIVNKQGNLVYLSDAPDRDILADFRAWLSE